MDAWMPPGIEENEAAELGYGVYGCVIEVTKEMARKWLEDTTLQPEQDRHLRPKEVATLRRKMDRGEWVLSGDSVRFTDEKQRVDAQHRLHAFIDSSLETLLTLVLWGLPPEAQQVIDGGAKRTMGNRLSIDGEVSGSALAATVQTVFSFTPDGDWYSQGPDARGSYAQARTFIDKHPDVRDTVRYATNRKSECKTVGVPPRIVAGLRFEQLRRGADESTVDEFWDGVLEGIGLGRQDARRLLRDRLERSAHNRSRSKPNIGPREQVGLIAKTWSKWANDEAVRSLRFIPSSEKVLPMDPGEKSNQPHPVQQ